MGVAIYVGLSLYGLNMLLGLAAKLRGAKFGVWHHVLYAAVFAAAIAAAFTAYHPALWVTLVALGAMPLVSARTMWHPAIASLGLLGYLASILWN